MCTKYLFLALAMFASTLTGNANANAQTKTVTVDSNAVCYVPKQAKPLTVQSIGLSTTSVPTFYVGESVDISPAVRMSNGRTTDEYTTSLNGDAATVVQVGSGIRLTGVKAGTLGLVLTPTKDSSKAVTYPVTVKEARSATGVDPKDASALQKALAALGITCGAGGGGISPWWLLLPLFLILLLLAAWWATRRIQYVEYQKNSEQLNLKAQEREAELATLHREAAQFVNDQADDRREIERLNREAQARSSEFSNLQNGVAKAVAQARQAEQDRLQALINAANARADQAVRDAVRLEIENETLKERMKDFEGRVVKEVKVRTAQLEEQRDVATANAVGLGQQLVDLQKQFNTLRDHMSQLEGHLNNAIAVHGNMNEIVNPPVAQVAAAEEVSVA